MTMTISSLGNDILFSQDSDIGTSSFIISVEDDHIYENEKLFVVLIGDSPECAIPLQILDNDGNDSY